MEEEIWKEIDGYNGAYMISNLGRVKSVARYSLQNHLLPERILQPCNIYKGYLDVILSKNGKRKHEKIHRLVAKAFVPNPRNLNEVDHIDTNKSNNRWDNLRWVTHSENHLNPLTVELKRKTHLGFKRSKESIEKQCKKISVIKDNIVIHTFNSYKEMDEKSKEIFGFTLWNVYARKVIKGLLQSYHGFTFVEA